MNVGQWVQTPRFCGVRISEVFSSEADARAAGFVEPTHYQGTEWGVMGKSLDMYHMEFAAYQKGQP